MVKTYSSFKEHEVPSLPSGYPTNGPYSETSDSSRRSSKTSNLHLRHFISLPLSGYLTSALQFAFVVHAPPFVFSHHVRVNEASRSLLRSFLYFWFLIDVPCYFRLRMLRDGGVIHRLRLNNWPYLGQDEVKSTTVGVDLRAVAPLLVLLSSSVVVSIVVLTLERGKITFCSSGTQNTTRRERNICRQRSAFKTSALSKPTCPVFDIRKTQSTAYGFQ